MTLTRDDIRAQSVGVGKLADTAARLGLLTGDDPDTVQARFGELIAVAAGVSPDDGQTNRAILGVLADAADRWAAELAHHQAHPVVRSVRDHDDVFIPGPGTARSQYPLTAVCSVCLDGIYCADSTADWCHLGEAAFHIVRPKVRAQLAGEMAAETGLTSPELAALTGEPPSAVRRALAGLEHDGLVRYAKSGGNEDLVRWFLYAGVNPPQPGTTLRERIVFWLSGANAPLGWTTGWIADQCGVTAGAARTELDAMREAGIVRFSRRGRKVTWYLLPGGNQL